MKKIKHITINLTEDEYNSVLFIANKERRTLANTAYLLLIDSLNDEILKAVSIHDSGFYKKVA